MAKQTKARRVGKTARSAMDNPYLRRIVEDEDLRDNLREAFESARGAYLRVSNGRKPAKTLLDDRKTQRKLRSAAESLREASDQLRGRRRKRRVFSKLLAAGVVGAALALVLSEDLRKALLDKLFGAEEEFEYTSTTAPASGTAGTAS